MAEDVPNVCGYMGLRTLLIFQEKKKSIRKKDKKIKKHIIEGAINPFSISYLYIVRIRVANNCNDVGSHYASTGTRVMHEQQSSIRF